MGRTLPALQACEQEEDAKETGWVRMLVKEVGGTAMKTGTGMETGSGVRICRQAEPCRKPRPEGKPWPGRNPGQRGNLGQLRCMHTRYAGNQDFFRVSATTSPKWPRE